MILPVSFCDHSQQETPAEKSVIVSSKEHGPQRTVYLPVKTAVATSAFYGSGGHCQLSTENEKKPTCWVFRGTLTCRPVVYVVKTVVPVFWSCIFVAQWIVLRATQGHPRPSLSGIGVPWVSLPGPTDVP